MINVSIKIPSGIKKVYEKNIDCNSMFFISPTLCHKTGMKKPYSIC
jgi:hypothetical protein